MYISFGEVLRLSQLAICALDTLSLSAKCCYFLRSQSVGNLRWHQHHLCEVGGGCAVSPLNAALTTQAIVVAVPPTSTAI